MHAYCCTRAIYVYFYIYLFFLALSRTCPQAYHLRAVLISGAPHTQLAISIIAPAHEAAARYDRTHVTIPRGDGGGGDA